MVIVEKQYDVTKLPERYVIAHCISCDCAMGAGVALTIRKKFPNIKRKCLEYTQNTKNSLGTAFRYNDKSGRIIYNLFTKQNYWQKAGYALKYESYMYYLEKCLKDLKQQMLNNQENILGVPKIGCGLDRCKWEDVKSLIIKIFDDTDINILVCYL